VRRTPRRARQRREADMAATNAEFLGLPQEQRHALEARLWDFDRAWGEGLLAARARALPADQPWRRPLLVEMVKIDLERRWQRGRGRRVEDYLRESPELGTAQTVPADLLQAEYEVRRQFGEPADLDDVARRFPERADELRRLVEQVATAV